MFYLIIKLIAIGLVILIVMFLFSACILSASISRFEECQEGEKHAD